MPREKYWLSIIFPIAAVSSGFSILIPLYILSLHGNVIDVGIATTAYELVTIPASIIWGELTQRLKKIKSFIMFSVLGVIPLILLLYFIESITLAIIMYAAYAFVLTASSPAINVLIMNKRKKTILRSYYGIYSLLSIIGNIIGYIPGVLLFSDIIARYLIILLSFNVASAILTFLLVNKDRGRAKSHKESLLHRLFPLLNSISTLPQILTEHGLIVRISNIRRRKKISRIFTIFAAIALFNFGLYLFNTSYIPFLYSFKLSFSDIFLINVLNGIGQIIIYAIFMTGKVNRRLRDYYRLSTFIRSAGYLIAALSVFVIAGIVYLNMFSYLVAGIGYAFWNVSASVIMYVNIAGKSEAHYIGLWSAVIGFSGVVGSFLSGFISFYSGYMLTFAISIAFTLLSTAVFSHVYKDGEKIADFGNRI